jgi:hypothetical protein
VLGEWDQDTPPYMANALFPLLTGAASKRLVILGRGRTACGWSATAAPCSRRCRCSWRKRRRRDDGRRRSRSG